MKHELKIYLIDIKHEKEIKFRNIKNLEKLYWKQNILLSVYIYTYKKKIYFNWLLKTSYEKYIYLKLLFKIQSKYFK